MPAEQTTAVSYVAYADKLPSLPKVALDVLALARQESVDLAAIAKVVSCDPALSARILKLSNSPLYARRRQASSINEAVMTLGLKAVKLAALSFSLTGVVSKSDDMGGYDLKAFWRRAMVQSVTGRIFAKALNLQCVDEAFTCGLMMDLAVPVLARAAGAAYWPVLEAAEGGHPAIAAEQAQMGTTHATVGAEIMQGWKLPDLISHAVRYHHAPDTMPETSGAAAQELARVLYLSHLVATMLTTSQRAEALFILTDRMKVWFNRDSALIDTLLAEIDPGVMQLADIVNVDIGGALKVAEVLEQARTEIVTASLATACELGDAQSRMVELEKTASTDSLTGLSNRAHFDATMKAAWDQRTGDDLPDPLGVIMADVDHFKRFNDSFGHQAGDEVLRLVGAAIRSCARTTDVPCRYGGEEFIIIAPGASGVSLKALAERLRRTVEKIEIQTEQGPQKVTASFGTASLVSDPLKRAFTELVEAADKAMYEAKKSGRNRVVAGSDL